MEKAYDLAVLVTRLKALGLHVTEEAAKGAIVALGGWLTDSVKASATPFDDVALVVIPKLVDAALKEADKIDGVVSTPAVTA